MRKRKIGNMRINGKEREEIEMEGRREKEEEKKKKWGVKKVQSAGKDVKSNIWEEKETPHRE